METGEIMKTRYYRWTPANGMTVHHHPAESPPDQIITVYGKPASGIMLITGYIGSEEALTYEEFQSAVKSSAGVDIPVQLKPTVVGDDRVERAAKAIHDVQTPRYAHREWEEEVRMFEEGIVPGKPYGTSYVERVRETASAAVAAADTVAAAGEDDWLDAALNRVHPQCEVVDLTICYGASDPKYLASLRVRRDGVYSRELGDSNSSFKAAILNAVDKAVERIEHGERL